MLTNRFQPINLNDLDQKAEELEGQADRVVGAAGVLDERKPENSKVDAADRAEQCHVVEDIGHDTAPRWTSRVIGALPLGKGPRKDRN